MKRLAILFLSVAWCGCSTTPHLKAVDSAGPPPLYIYWGSEDANSADRFLTARLHLGENIYVAGDDFWELKGHVDPRGANLVADLVGNTGQQAQFYRGPLALDTPAYAQGGAASGGAGPPYWFLVSTNPDCRKVLEHVNAVRGFTGMPFDHSHTLMPFSNTSHSPPGQIPLPANTNMLVDPNTGLPISPKHEN